MTRAQRSIEATAAAWLVRLNDPACTRADVTGHQDWLDERPEHAAAHAAASEIWLGLDLVARPQPARASRAAERPFRWAPAGLAAGLAACLIGAGAWLWNLQHSTFATDVGERQAIVLKDGSEMALNTNSRVTVDFSRRERRVRLRHGEAIFHVARDPQRPFVVEADNVSVRALGTQFSVRRPDEGTLEVTLLEGKVVVQGPQPVPVTLQPGERFKRSQGGTTTLDRPRLDQVTAWRRGEVLLDHTPLATAVNEMNRYSRVKIDLAPDAAPQGRLSGVFKTGESRQFAATIAALYGLSVHEEPQRLRLERRPAV